MIVDVILMTDGGLAALAGWRVAAGWRVDAYLIVRTYMLTYGMLWHFQFGTLITSPALLAPPLYEQRSQIAAMDSDSDLDLGSGGGMKPSPSALVCVGTREVTMGTSDRSKAPVPSILACFRAKESANGGGDDTKASPSALTLMFTDGFRTYSGR